MLLPEEEARKRIEALPAGDEPRIKWAGFDLPGETAEGNLLTVGSIGTGKTLMHRDLMRSVIPGIRPGSDRRALVYDVKSDLLSNLFSMKPASEVIVFNPFDKRAVAWDIAADVKTPHEARDFAGALIVPDKAVGSPFFTDSARAIVVGVINSLNRTHHGNWDLRRLILLTANRRRLERVLAGSDLIDQYFKLADVFSNIQSTIANVMGKLEAVAGLSKHAGQKISLKQWVKSGDSILVMGENANAQSSVQFINRLAFKMISTACLSESESLRCSRLWFFCDELKAAGRLDSLPALLNARSKGVRCVLGLQDIEGLDELYGNAQVAKEILDRCATVSWLKLNSADTAQWAAERCGHLLLPSEFLNLPTFSSGKVHSVHMIKGLAEVFKASTRYEFPKSDVLDFDPRPDSEQFLEPWGAEDDQWLDAGK